MKQHYVRKVLSFTFSHIGYHIGSYPQAYIAIPFLLSLICATGFLNISLVTDMEYLFIPSNTRSERERSAIESLFPVNNSEVYFGRITRFDSYGSILIVPKNETFMLDEYIIDDLLKLDNLVKNISIIWNNNFVRYEDLCCKLYEGKCFDFSSLLLKLKAGVNNDMCNIKYPIDKRFGTAVMTAYSIGGEVLQEESCVKNFKAFRLFYLLDANTKEKKQIALKWEEEFVNVLSKINMQYIEFYDYGSNRPEKHLSNIVQSGLHLFVSILPIILLFTSVSCMTSDAVTSKPWLGIASCLSPFLSTVSAFGLLLHCKMEFIDLNLVIFFLLLGVGLDDSFIMIAAWRRTDKNDPVPNRMSEAYAEAAVSITLTSLTNFLAFCMTYLIPYRFLRIISIYTSLSIVFDYMFQIFFFGGLMALDGYREKYKIHSITCFPLSTAQTSEQKIDNKEKEENFIMKFFSNILPEFLAKISTKMVVAIFFIIYLAGSLYCLKFITVGGDFIKIFPSSSKAVKYLEFHSKYFTTYPHQVQVVINETLDYSDKNIQNDIKQILRTFETATFMANSSFTENWMREYLSFIDSPLSKFSLSGYNMSNSDDFIQGLKNVFLKIKSARRFRNDIVLNSEGNKIIASRFLVATHNVKNSTAEKILMENMYRIADNCKYSVYVYNFWFIYYETYFNVTWLAIQTICITAILMLIIFIILIPNIKLTLSAAVIIISIQLGMIGYMSLWNISLDTTALVNLVVSIGFSVDYMAHTSYAYIRCNADEQSEKLKVCLRAAGYPVFQSCITTLICIIALIFGPSYQYIVFSKMLFLMIIFAIFHSLIILPVALSFIDIFPKYFRKIKIGN